MPYCFVALFSLSTKFLKDLLDPLQIPMQSSMNLFQNLIWDDDMSEGSILLNNVQWRNESAICLERLPPVGIPTFGLYTPSLYVTYDSAKLNLTNDSIASPSFASSSSLVLSKRSSIACIASSG